MSLQTAFLYPLQAAISPFNNKGWLRRLLVGIALTLATVSVAQAATDCNAVTEISKVECESLLQLYHSTDGANWTNNAGWNVTNTPCSWKGISCANNGVTKIDLQSNNLNGTIPDFSGLPKLTRLSLYHNQLTGAVPDFSGLPNLTRLYLYDNQLTGAVPDFSGLPNLTWLELGGNQLTGAVPNFSGLPKLTRLYLFNNQLTGAVPNFSGLPNLTRFYLSENQLTGAVPDFSGLPNLTRLELGDNKLTGAVPDFSGLPKLERLALSNNQLTGTIPDLSTFTNLKRLTLHDNQLCKDSHINYANLPIEYAYFSNAGWNSSPTWQEVLNGFPNCSVNQAPTAQFTASPSQGVAPLRVNLDASQSADTDGTINQYNWTANGQTLSGKTTSTTFTGAGEYTLVLTVTDNQGLTATTQKTVIVTRPNQAPTAAFTASPSQGKAPLTVNLDASDSKDEGTLENYEWLVNGQKLFGIKAATTLTAAGEYQITLTVTDNDGLTATQQQTITVTTAITVVEPPTGADQAIIIAAGSAHKNTLFRYTNDFTQRFYRLLKQQGFQDDDIHYLNPHAPDIDPWDGYLEDERQDFDLFDPELELLQAFKQAGERLKAGQRLVLYLHGHARPNYFKIKWDYELSAETFSQLLTRIPDGVEQVIILDTCFAGSFLDELKGVANRIVVTSSDEKSRAWEIKYGGFSDKLIREIRRGKNLNEAFTTASEMITSQPALFREQQPCLDDDGDGQCSTSDGRRAAQIDLADKHGEQVPEIVQVHPRRTLSGATATLWVTVLPSSPDAIKQVRAILIRPNLQVPDYQGELTDFGRTELPLLYNAAKQRYEGDYDHFCTSGTWYILYQAQNTDGVWSDIKKGYLEQAPNIQAPICRVPMTINMGLNNFRYTAGDTFRLDMTMDGEGLADVYVAIVFPNGDFITLTYPEAFSFLNTPNPYRQGVTISGKRVYSSVLDLALPPGLPLGHYSACGVLIQPTAVDILDANNWIHFHCEVLELY